MFRLCLDFLVAWLELLHLIERNIVSRAIKQRKQPCVAVEWFREGMDDSQEVT